MTANSFVPERGEIIWIDMNPQAGHEQSGRRPALVLSPSSYNGRTGLAVLCPLSLKIKGYPFEVALSNESEARGVVLADQVRSLDWRVRNAAAFDVASNAVVQDVTAKLAALIGC